MYEPILTPSKETKEQIWKEFGLNEQRVKEAVETIMNWLVLQPHLPKEYDEGRLERWLIRCKNSIERTKQSLETYYRSKTVVPELMSNWNANSDWFQDITNLTYVTPMPKLTADCNRVITVGFLSSDSAKFIGDDFFKLGLMVMEVRMSEDYSLSDIYVLDMANYSLGHVPKISLPTLNKAEVCLMKGYSTRLKALYVINAPPYGKYLVDLMKLVLKTKLAARVHVYGADFTALYDHVPKKCLLKHLGGTGGTIEENWDQWKKKLQSYESWFRFHENVKSDETKRPVEVTNDGTLFGFEGSFRHLNLD